MPEEVTLLSELSIALDRVQDDPSASADVARRALADTSGGDSATKTVATWVLGRAAYESGDVTEANRYLTEALELARLEGDEVKLAQIRNSLAAAQFAAGDTDAALRGVALAEVSLQGAERGRALVQAGMFHIYLGRLREGIAKLNDAHDLIDWSDDPVGEARLLTNRAVAEIQVGRLDDGERDLLAALALAEQLEQDLMIGGTIHNLGYLQGRRGDIPAALASFAQAREAYERLEDPIRAIGNLEMDNCEVLLQANLVVESEAAAGKAIEAASISGNEIALGESELLMARAKHAAGDREGSVRWAAEASRDFRAAERWSWAALADYYTMEVRSDDAVDLLRLAETLEGFGWEVEALHTRAAAVGRAAEAGDGALTARLAASAREATRRGTVAQRAAAWQLRAETAMAEGDRTAAKRSLAHGVRLVERHRGGLGASDLQARAGGHALTLVEERLRLALEDGRPVEVLAWADRLRGASLDLPAIRPPDDPTVSEGLERLRSLRAESRAAAGEGRDTSTYSAQIARLERSVRDAARLGRGPGHDQVSLDLSALKAALDGSVLVEYVDFGSQLLAVVVADGRVRLVDLGPLEAVQTALASTLFAMRRLLSAQQRTPSADAARDLQASTAAVLAELLFGPAQLGSDVPVTVVPTGPLFSVPWGSLRPGESPVTVAPSAAMWLRLQEVEMALSRKTALIAGPDLPGADAEVVQLAERLPGARTLRGSAATVGAVGECLSSTDLAHIAAHGVFRADNPQFSSLALADGPMTLYDIEALPAVPTTVVLPACDAGRAEVLDGDELLGTAFALLQVGVRTVVAPIMPIPDAASVDFMLEVHSGLGDGLSPSVALANAGRSDGVSQIVAAAFLSIGA